MSRILFRISLEGYATENNFQRWCRREGIKCVQRITVNAFGEASCQRAWITSYDDFYKFIVFSGWVDQAGLVYDITGCNKQYVSSLVPGMHSTYLGSMCEVSIKEAQDHVADGGWSLLNTETDTIWIAQKRNPDRISDYTSHGLVGKVEEARWPVDPRCPANPLTYRADDEELARLTA